MLSICCSICTTWHSSDCMPINERSSTQIGPIWHILTLLDKLVGQLYCIADPARQVITCMSTRFTGSLLGCTIYPINHAHSFVTLSFVVIVSLKWIHTCMTNLHNFPGFTPLAVAQLGISAGYGQIISWYSRITESELALRRPRVEMPTASFWVAQGLLYM